MDGHRERTASVKRFFAIAIPVTLAVAGVTLLLVGAFLGQPNNVFQKAIRVCMECIGIG